MTVKHLLTLEEFWELPEPPDMQQELVRGEVVEVPPPGAVHNWIVGTIYRLLWVFAHERRLGAVFGDNMGYVLSREPATVRVPDVSFVARERIPAAGLPAGAWLIPPDLAVEVVSPTDRLREIEDKVQDYLAAGVRLIWVVRPEARTVVVHTVDNAPDERAAADTLDGADVLPGFGVPIAELFRVDL